MAAGDFDGLGRRRRGDLAALARDRGRGDAGHAAWIDQVEVPEVDGHVEGDSVVAHASFDAEAERPDLAWVGTGGVAPAARMAVAWRSGHAESGARREKCPPARANERPDHQSPVREPDDRIRDELAATVV